MLPPLLNEFGFLANKELADQVMEGMYEAPPNKCPYTIEFSKKSKILEAKKSGKVKLEMTPEQN